MPRPRHALLVVAALAALGATACQRPRVALEPVFQVRTDGGADVDCAQITDLACVNFIKFQIAEQGDLTPSTECITVDQRLTTLCDVAELAKGAEIFRFDKGARVQIKMWGLRVFPATSCEIIPECPAKSLFSGATDTVKLGDVPGGQLPLRITDWKDCGRKEVYRPRGGRDCFNVCDFSEPVCSMQDGCVCLLPQDDAGVPESGGSWKLTDGGVD